MGTRPRTLARVVVEGFRRDVGGTIVEPQDEAYDEARAVWNGSIDRYPALIVRPAGVPDVAATIRRVREADVPLAVRGGGHSIAGWSTCDDGVVLDLSAMKAIDVDPQRRRALVEPGVVWRELDAATQAHGLAVTGGLISTTGVAGFTLGGGIGWLQRSLGLACDRLVAADVVTADGRVVRASAVDGPELLWGLRGGGGNFGVVVSMEFDLAPVGPDLLCGLAMYPGDRAAEVLRFFRDFQPEAPDALAIAAVLRLAPPAPFVPEALHGRPVVALALVHAGDVETARRDVAPLGELGQPVADLVAVRPYTEMQTMLDASWTPGFQNYWKAEYVRGLPDEAVDVLVAHLASITSPLSDAKIPFLGGAIARGDSAYGHRAAPFIVSVSGRWEDPADAHRHVAWTRSLWEALQPFSDGGTYVNFMSADDASRVRDSFDDAAYARLVALKRRHDPDNVFRLNHNVDPGAAGAGASG